MIRNEPEPVEGVDPHGFKKVLKYHEANHTSSTDGGTIRPPKDVVWSWRST